MTFYLQYDETISHDLINGKRIKKLVSSELAKLKIKFTKVTLSIEEFSEFSVSITAVSDFEQFDFECEDSCLKKAVEKCVKGLVENCKSLV